MRAGAATLVRREHAGDAFLDRRSNPQSVQGVMSEQQSKIDSLMETVTDTATGFLVSIVINPIVGLAVGVHFTVAQNFGFVGLYTATSLVRRYLVRRTFNGRSVWSTIKGKFS
jgi:hypothetical protein